MNKRIRLTTVVSIVILLFIGYKYYNNSYTRLKPIQMKSGNLALIPYTNEMIKNFPDVLKHYNVPYRINDSGIFLIQVKYAHDRDLILTMTDCTLDSSLMNMVRTNQWK